MQKHWCDHLFPRFTGSTWARTMSLLVGVSMLAGLLLYRVPIAQAKVGTIDEFRIPTAGSSPDGITTGPDGNLWFTESKGTRTTSGASPQQA